MLGRLAGHSARHSPAALSRKVTIERDTPMGFSLSRSARRVTGLQCHERGRRESYSERSRGSRCCLSSRVRAAAPPREPWRRRARASSRHAWRFCRSRSRSSAGSVARWRRRVRRRPLTAARTVASRTRPASTSGASACVNNWTSSLRARRQIGSNVPAIRNIGPATTRTAIAAVLTTMSSNVSTSTAQQTPRGRPQSDGGGKPAMLSESSPAHRGNSCGHL